MRSQVIELYRKLGNNKQQPTTVSGELSEAARKAILSKVYLLEKRGKTFGSSQFRRFIIENGKLFQESEKQRKEIALPQQISMEIRIPSRKWNEECQGRPIRLHMVFDYRSPIYVYFSDITESQEIFAYVSSLMLKQKGKSISRFAGRWKQAVSQSFLECLTKRGDNHLQITARETKRNAIAAALYRWNAEDPLHSTLETWQRLAEAKELSQKVLMKFRALSFKTNQQLLFVSPVLKVYVNGRPVLEVRLVSTKDNGKLVFKNNDATFIETRDALLKDELMLEIIDGRAKWKSERMQLVDLWRYNCSIVGIPLQSSQPYPIVLFEYSFVPECTQRPLWNLPLSFTPDHYNVLTEVMGCENHHEPTVQHQLFTNRLQRHLKCRFEETIFYWMRRFTENLELDDLISKGLQSEPFCRMGQMKVHRGTVIYRHFVQLSRNMSFYDVEKILWKHEGHVRLRRLLNALKTFDAQPRRINFTEKLYFLTLRLFEMVSMTTPLLWNERLFENSAIGRESAVFFFTLVLARQTASNYWSCTTKAKGLSNNSMLFAYVLKVINRQLWDKINRLEVNVETLFGEYSVSLFAELIGGQTFFRVLDAFITEVKTFKPEYNLTLIGLFLSLLDRVSALEAAFESAENFLMAVMLVARNIIDPYEFLRTGDHYIQRIRKELTMPRFLQLRQQMDSFYRQQQSDEPAHLAIPKFYATFSNYQHKAERVERTLLIRLDKIDLHAECPKLTLYLFQNNQQLLEHKFVERCMQQLDFTMKMRLESLSDVILAVLLDNATQVQFCRLSPRYLPCNCSFSLVLLLEKEERYAMAEDDCNCMHLQLIINEGQEALPQIKLDAPRRYLDFFMDTQDIKVDVTLLHRYNTTVRHSENNFNLLYSQLGWFNGCYLMPHDRLLNMYAAPGELYECEEGELAHFFKVARYSRCVYGRAVLCNTGRNYFIEFEKNGVRCYTIHHADQPADMRASFAASSLLSCYPLETVTPNHNSYLEFYLNVMELPLIDYLGYSPSRFVEVPELSFDLFLADQRSAVIFTQDGDHFRDFSEDQTAEIESAITFRKLKLRPKHLFRLPEMGSCLDNFLYQLRLNILHQIITVEPPAPDKSLVKWPNRVAVKTTDMAKPLPNMPVGTFLSLVAETKQSISLEFIEAWKPYLKQFDSLAELQCYRQWRRVDVLCQIDSIYRYFLVQEELTRRKFIVAEANLVLGRQPKVRIACEAEELRQRDSALQKKLDRLF